MAETVTAVGIDVEQIVADALLEAEGSQKAYYITQLVAALGVNPKVRLKRDGTTVYEATLSAGISNVDGSLAVPASWNSPTTNSAADIDSGAWLFEIEKATDSGVRLSMSAGPSGADVVANLSQDLDGSASVVPSLMLFQCPVSLDASSGDEPSLTMQTVISDMSLNNDDDAYGFSSKWARRSALLSGENNPFVAWGSNWDSQVQLPWFRNQPGMAPWLQTRYWRYPIAWMVPYIGDTHDADNIALLMKYFRILRRRRDNGQWSVLRYSNDGHDSRWYQATLELAIGTGGGIVTRKPEGRIEVKIENIFNFTESQRYAHHGDWGGQSEWVDETPYDVIIHAFMAKLDLWDPFGVDELDDASILPAVGADPYPDPSFNAGIADAIMPSIAHSRLKKVTRNWQWFTMGNVLTARQEHVGPTCSVTTQSLLNNPPPASMLQGAL